MSRKLSKEKVQNILNGGAEPVFTAEDMATDESKSRALDRGMYWYRQSFSPNTAKEWITDWFVAKGRDDEAQIVGRAGKQHLRLVVPYCRMESRGFQFSTEQQATIENYITDLVRDARQHAPAEASVSNIQVRIRAKADELLGELEILLDDIFTGILASRYKPVIASWIASKPMNRPTALFVRQRLDSLLKEVLKAHQKTDPDLMQGYDWMPKPAMTKLIKILEESVSGLNLKINSMTATRKPRKRKIISPEALVKRLKYSDKNAELGLTSVDPRGIVGSQGLVMFNTKNKRATVYTAAEPKVGLSVKGSTVTGWCVTQSVERTVRKPKQLFGAKRTFAGTLKAVQSLTTKTLTPTGRINKHCVLVQVA